MQRLANTNPDEDEYEYDEEVEEVDEEDPKSLDERGLPKAGPYESVNPAVLYPIMMAVFLGIGYLLAWAISNAYEGEKVYTDKIALLQANKLEWLYLAVFVAGLILPIQQVFVAYNRKMAKVPNPDQYIFKTMLGDGAYVRLETKGAVGAFNRSQRGIDNTRETFGGQVLSLVFAFQRIVKHLSEVFVFPEAALLTAQAVLLVHPFSVLLVHPFSVLLVHLFWRDTIPFLFYLSIVLLLGRVAYSAGYISKGSARMPGGLLSTIASVIINGQVLFTTVQIFHLRNQ